MDMGAFWAKILGIYMLIVALAWLLRKDSVERSVKEIFSSEGLVAFSGLLNLLLGLFILISHPHFEWNWRGLITFFGLAAVIGGLFRFLYPKKAKKLTAQIFKDYSLIPLSILIVLGAYLTYSGFYGI